MTAKILQLSRFMKVGKESKPASFLEKVIALQHQELDVFYYVRHNTNKYNYSAYGKDTITTIRHRY
jgi:hypothetical protein